jgi:DNA repair protein RecO
MQIHTDGIVLRSFQTEDDRILTILSRQHGIITAYAGGASRPKRQLAGATELLCHSHFVLFYNRGRYSVDKAESARIFFGIRNSIEHLALGAYFAQLAVELSPGEEPAQDCFDLLLGCLHYLENQKRPLAMLKPLYELRSLTLAGYMPDLVACRDCGCYEADSMYFSLAAGDLLCPACTDGHQREALPPGVLAGMRHILYSPLRRVFSFRLSAEGLQTLQRVSELYIKHQLEKTLPTLEYYNGLAKNPFAGPNAINLE